MPFIPDAQPTTGGYFEPDEEKTLAGFGNNLVSDVKENASGIGHLAQGLVEHPIDTATNVVKGLPGGLVNEGKRLGIGELLTGHPINAVSKFVDAAYDKPLTTGMEVIPALGAAGKAFGTAGEAARTAEMAGEAANLAKAGAKAGAVEEAIPAAASVAQEAAPVEAATEEAAQAAKASAGGAAKAAPAVEEAAGAEKAAGAAEVASDPLQEVKDYVSSKYGKAAAQPGWPEKLAKYLKNEVSDFRGKDIGLQGNQVRQMGEGFKGIEKAEALMDYAGEKGYFKPGLTDLERKNQIIANMNKAGETVGAIRDIAIKRGEPPLDLMYNNVEAELLNKYGIKAPGQVKEVLKIIKKGMKDNPTFSGVADISTDLNKELRNIRSMGRHIGPNTDAADMLSRMNNDAIRKVLNPKEAEAYTESLRDYGAHKKLEKAAAGAGRRKMTGRSNQRGPVGRLWQEALDRGGYRIAGNVADRTANAILKSPGKVKTLPNFFEELVHQAEDVMDESLEAPGMAHGGIVGELDDFLTSKYGKGDSK